MRYEWDPEKARANVVKHGVRFETIADFDWARAFTRPDDRFDYEERRWVSIGPVGERLFKVVYTYREGCVRVISMHKANLRDRRKFDERS